LSCSYIFIYHNNVVVLTSFFYQMYSTNTIVDFSNSKFVMQFFRSPAEQKLTLRHSVPWSVHCGRYLTVVFVASMYE
jgi:hypothetical protein